MDNYFLNKTDKGWQLKKEGASRPSLTADTKEQAMKDMRQFMSNKVGSVKIQKENGQFQEERTYQRRNDPSKSKG